MSLQPVSSALGHRVSHLNEAPTMLYMTCQKRGCVPRECPGSRIVSSRPLGVYLYFRCYFCNTKISAHLEVFLIPSLLCQKPDYNLTVYGIRNLFDPSSHLLERRQPQFPIGVCEVCSNLRWNQFRSERFRIFRSMFVLERVKSAGCDRTRRLC